MSKIMKQGTKRIVVKFHARDYRDKLAIIGTSNNNNNNSNNKFVFLNIDMSGERTILQDI